MKKFFQKWGNFLGIIFSPGSVSPLIIAAFCLYFAFTKSGTPLSILLTIIASILTAIAGFFIKDDWDKLKGDSVLEKKGRSAIRNLDAISQQIIQIRDWAKLFIGQKKITRRELEEIDRHLGTIEMNAKAGLQDWVDIIPELKKTAEVTKTYEDVLKVYIEEILKNKKELLTAGKNQQLKEELEEKIKDLEKRFRELKKESPRVFTGGGITMGPFVSGGSSRVFSRLDNKICSECGRTYYDDNLLAISAFNRDICPDCKKKLGL